MNPLQILSSITNKENNEFHLAKQLLETIIPLAIPGEKHGYGRCNKEYFILNYLSYWLNDDMPVFGEGDIVVPDDECYRQFATSIARKTLLVYWPTVEREYKQRVLVLERILFELLPVATLRNLVIDLAIFSEI